MRRCVAHKIKVLYPRSRPQLGQKSNSCLSHNSESTEANLMKLHRKIDHNVYIRFRFLCPRSRPQPGQRSNSCLSHNAETTEANLMKLHRKIKHNEKVCHVKDLSSFTQVTIRSEVKLCPKWCLSNYLQIIEVN